MKTEDLERLVFAQGWVGNQIANLKPESQYEQTLYGQWQEMWNSLDAGIDALVQESLMLTSLEMKLAEIKKLAGRNPLEEKLEGIANLLS